MIVNKNIKMQPYSRNMSFSKKNSFVKLGNSQMTNLHSPPAFEEYVARPHPLPESEPFFQNRNSFSNVRRPSVARYWPEPVQKIVGDKGSLTLRDSIDVHKPAPVRFKRGSSFLGAPSSGLILRNSTGLGYPYNPQIQNNPDPC
jgi:hypothetical protein